MDVRLEEFNICKIMEYDWHSYALWIIWTILEHWYSILYVLSTQLAHLIMIKEISRIATKILPELVVNLGQDRGPEQEDQNQQQGSHK